MNRIVFATAAFQVGNDGWAPDGHEMGVERVQADEFRARVLPQLRGGRCLVCATSRVAAGGALFGCEQ